MISKIANIFKVKDLRKKVLFTLTLLIVYRLGGQVMIPGFASMESVLDFTSSSQAGIKDGILSLYDQFVGGFYLKPQYLL